MSLDDVAAVLGPPPRSSFAVDWGAVEQRLGLRLPQDYKDFAQAYGPVLIGEWLWVFVPHESDPVLLPLAGWPARPYPGR